eukprot:NODE_676_length_5303_cov_0.411991.p1 type:complete len:439 gc:universal NODE_676_length_5303_cov_0.411991:1906-3222(+)
MTDFDTIIEPLVLSTKQLKSVEESLINEMRMGLRMQGKGLKMLPSYLYGVPTGREKGTFLALDLGGTNFRVVRVDLLGSGKVKTDYLKYTIPDELKVSNAVLLFDFIANSVKDFLGKHNIADPKLGFTFSFPCKQLNINKAVLLNWTKGFTANGVIGNDVVELLRQSFSRNNIDVDCVAVVNDTVGTLLAHAYESPNTKVAVILGTGTNAAYIEDCSKMIKDDFICKSSKSKILVNIEWGAFDLLPFTSYDEELDADTPNKNQQRFEKMVSGMYLGEITRLVLIDLIKRNILFQGKSSDILNTPHSFKTRFMSVVESDKSPSLDDVKELMHSMQITEMEAHDLEIVKKVVEQVGTRSARLSGAVLSGVLVQSQVLDSNQPVVVAVDGSLFELYPDYQKRIEAALTELLQEKAKLVKLELARDGSSVGAALGALVSLHM